jgi:F-type H+-transporting ATPase subunit epsilon
MATFRLQVVTPERVVLDDDAASLVAPGIEGYLGVLPNHAPMVTELGVGELRYTTPRGAEFRLAVGGGFMQVTGDRTTVLADSAERAEQINLDRAREALQRATELRQELGAGTDPGRQAEAEAEIERARNRLKVAGGG